MIAGLQACQEYGGDGGHAGGGGTRDGRAFQLRHALLEHGDGGIGQAGILEARAFALEAGFGFFGRVIGIAGGENQRFAGFLESRAHLAAAHRLGAPAPFSGFLVRRHKPLSLKACLF